MKSMVSLLLLLGLTSSASDDLLYSQQWSLQANHQTYPFKLDPLRTEIKTVRDDSDIQWGPLSATPSQNSVQNNAPTIVVAVIDSGIDQHHEDLQGAIQPGGKNFFFPDSDTRSRSISDNTGHGTHVAGIIAARSGNQLGITGIAPANVMILPLKVLDNDASLNSTSRLSDRVARAVRYAIQQKVAIINLSLGWPDSARSGAAYQSIQEAILKGILVVAAAGNENSSRPLEPCSIPGVFCVGASSIESIKTKTTNFGSGVDVMAPGEMIVSTFPTSLNSKELGVTGYERMSGTSQSAPVVSAIAATLLSLDPKLSVLQIKARIMASAQHYGRYPVSYRHSMLLVQKPLWIADWKHLQDMTVGDAVQKFRMLNIGVKDQTVKFEFWLNEKLISNQMVKGDQVEFDLPVLELDPSAVPDARIEIRLIHSDGTTAQSWMRVLTVRNRIVTNQKKLYPKVAVNELLPVPLISPNPDEWVFGRPVHEKQGLKIDILRPLQQDHWVTLRLGNLRLVDGLRYWNTLPGKERFIVWGKDSTGSQFEFKFFDSAGFETTVGHWSMPNIQLQASPIKTLNAIQRFEERGFWLPSQSSLIPCFIANSGYSDRQDGPDEFQESPKTDNHLYCWLPGRQVNEPMRLRTVDSYAFRKAVGDFKILGHWPVQMGGINLLIQKANLEPGVYSVIRLDAYDEQGLSYTVADGNLADGNLADRLKIVLEEAKNIEAGPAAFLSRYPFNLLQVEMVPNFSANTTASMFKLGSIASDDLVHPAVVIDTTLIRGNGISMQWFDSQTSIWNRHFANSWQLPNDCGLSSFDFKKLQPRLMCVTQSGVEFRWIQ